MDLVDHIGNLYDCGAEHRHHATPPIEVYRLDSKGNWELRHNDRQSADLTAGVRASAPKSTVFGTY